MATWANRGAASNTPLSMKFLCGQVAACRPPLCPLPPLLFGRPSSPIFNRGRDFVAKLVTGLAPKQISRPFERRVVQTGRITPPTLYSLVGWVRGDKLVRSMNVIKASRASRVTAAQENLSFSGSKLSRAASRLRIEIVDTPQQKVTTRSLLCPTMQSASLTLSVVRGVNRAIRSHLATLSARLARA